MRKNVEVIVNEMKSKVNGYAVMLHYRFSNLCVKAEPMSMLSITITDLEGDEHEFEDVADAIISDPYKIEILPKDQRMLFNICRGVMEAHPEFKQDIITSEETNRLDPENKEEQHILCTMPEVNQDRHDALVDHVSVLYDGCKSRIDATNAAYKTKLATHMEGMSKEEIDEANDNLKSVYDKYCEIIDNLRSQKDKEIEDAYEKYLTRQQKKHDAEQEIAAARGVDKGLTYNQNDEDNL